MNGRSWYACVCVYKIQHVGESYIMSIFTPPNNQGITLINPNPKMFYNRATEIKCNLGSLALISVLNYKPDFRFTCLQFPNRFLKQFTWNNDRNVLTVMMLQNFIVAMQVLEVVRGMQTGLVITEIYWDWGLDHCHFTFKVTEYRHKFQISMIKEFSVQRWVES